MKLAKKNVLKVSKKDFDTKQDISIYNYDAKIDNHHKVIILHPGISETTTELIESFPMRWFQKD